MVNTQPYEAIMVDGKYQFNKATNQWEHFENFAVNERDEAKGEKTFEWAEQHFRDMFAWSISPRAAWLDLGTVTYNVLNGNRLKPTLKY